MRIEKGSGWERDMENMLPSCSCGGRAYLEMSQPFYYVHCRKCMKQTELVRFGAGTAKEAVIRACNLWEELINGKE